MIEKFSTYIKESNDIPKLKNGDIVYTKGQVDDVTLDNQKGKIILTKEKLPRDMEYDYLILFDKKFNNDLHSGINWTGLDLPSRCFYVYKHNIIYDKSQLEEYLKRIERNKEKYKDIDPYNEEEWED